MSFDSDALPRLRSGELRVADAGRYVEEVV